MSPVSSDGAQRANDIGGRISDLIGAIEKAIAGAAGQAMSGDEDDEPRGCRGVVFWTLVALALWLWRPSRGGRLGW